jgi:hypothetical protein
MRLTTTATGGWEKSRGRLSEVLQVLSLIFKQNDFINSETVFQNLILPIYVTNFAQISQSLADAVRLCEEDIFSDSRPSFNSVFEHFKVPKYLQSTVYRRSNGFYACDKSVGENGTLTLQSTVYPL